MKISQKNNRKTKSTIKKIASDVRLVRGRVRDGARFTVAPQSAELPASYLVTLAEIKQHVQQSRLQAVIAANATMVLAYWEIGKIILTRQESDGWGSKVIDRLSLDLRAAFPNMRGFSPRNLKYMRSFAAAWSDSEFVQATLAQIGWYQNITLLDKISDSVTRIWYAKQAVSNGWSQPVLSLQIENQLHLRIGKAQNNFKKTMSPLDSDLATQIFKDPYLFDFLGTADARREREIEQALMDHIQKFLLELGTGFAFIGRQVHLEVGNQDFYLDLLFYHLKLRRYVVVELKAGTFSPSDVGQLNLYLSAVDDLLCHPDDQPAIGLLLCKEKNKLVVEYALRGLDQSIAVAEWQTKLSEKLPQELKGSLPTIEEIEAEFTK